MARILSVRERALRAVAEAFRQIQPENGFNTAVKQVRRLRVVPDHAEDPPEIHLVFGESQTERRSTDCEESVIPTLVLFYVRSDSMEPDTEYNLFLADIQRVIASQVIDTTAPGGREIFIESDYSDRPMYWEGAPGDVVGEVECAVRYSWKLGDPRLWDDEDQFVTE